MSESPPDRCAVDPRSPYHDSDALERGLGIRINGVEKTNVQEYCISEGWVRLPVPKSLDRRGNPMSIKIKGKVDVWFLDAPADGAPE